MSFVPTTTQNLMDMLSASDSDFSDSYEGDSNFDSSSSLGDAAGEPREDGSSQSSDENESQIENGFELAKITKEILKLPKGLCENAAIFQEFFSMQTWQMLPDNFKAYLKNKFLPQFPEEDEREKDITLEMLFSNTIQRFDTSPLIELQRNLEEGNYRPDVLKLRESIAKSRRREQRFQEYERVSLIAKNLLISREKLLRLAYDSPSGSVPKVNRIIRQNPIGQHLDASVCAVRARKRFHSEIFEMARQLEIHNLTEDESDEDFVTDKLNHNGNGAISDDFAATKTTTTANSNDKTIYGTYYQKISSIQTSPIKDINFNGSMGYGKGAGQMPVNCRLAPMPLCDKNFRKCLLEHKRRKIEEPDKPEFETNDIRLRDVHARTQMGGTLKRVYASGKTPGRKPKAKLLLEAQQAAEAEAAAAASVGNIPNRMISGNVSTSIQSQIGTISQNHHPYHQSSHQSSMQTIINSGSFCGDFSNLSEIVVANEVTIPNHESQYPSESDIDDDQSRQMDDEDDENFDENDDDEDGSQDNLMNIASKVISNKSVVCGGRRNADPHDSYGRTLIISNKNDLTGAGTEDGFVVNSTSYCGGGAIKAQGDIMNIPLDMDDGSCPLDNFFVSSNRVSATGGKRGPNELKKDEDKQIMQETNIQNRTNFVHSPASSPFAKTTVMKSTAPELMQETHACFLSLIRDIFCSTPNHRMKLDELKQKIDIWLANPITALNDWYCLVDNWSAMVTSAINFLAGDFYDQPEEYVPYIEYKSQLNIYQWIGASRDSDSRLLQLCNYWMDRKHEMTYKPVQKLDISTATRKSSTEMDVDSIGNLSDRVASPPLPRCPTTWTVQSSTPEEIAEFQRQERERFENPHKSFTYRMHGYESVVGPVKGIYSHMLAFPKARGHSMMIGDRPKFVTILTLVRDATARLPNGEGTRADISELLKCSQYINKRAQENVLQTIVSGALDRMHTEHDPCVRYDAKRKMWIYLHRNRSEEEFERLHQQYQGIGKHKKQTNRKVKPKSLPKELSQQQTITLGGVGGMIATAATTPTTNVQTITTTTAANQHPCSLPALLPANPIIVSSVGQQTNNNNQQQSQQQYPPVPPLKYSTTPAIIVNQKTIVKPDLVPIRSPIGKQQTQQLPQSPERFDLNATNTSEQTISSPNIQQQHHFVQIQKPIQKVFTTTTTGSAMQTKKINVSGSNTFVAATPSSSASSTSTVLNNNNNTMTPIIVATPTGIQTVHVSAAAASSSSNLVQSTTNANGQTGHHINMTRKFPIINKPIIINQLSQAAQLQTQTKLKSVQATGQQHHSQQQSQQQQQGFIIPINLNNTGDQQPQFKVISSVSSNSLLISGVGASGVVTSSPKLTVAKSAGTQNAVVVGNRQIVSANAFIQQQQQQQQQQQHQVTSSLLGKSNIRLVTTGGTAKSIISPQMTKTQTTQIIGQKIIPMGTTTAGRPTTTAAAQMQHKTIGGISLITSNSSGGNTGGGTVKMSPQAFATLQQKQLLHSFINKQQTQQQQQQSQQQQRLVIGNISAQNTVTTVIPQQQFTGANKNVIIQTNRDGQHIQKVINVSSNNPTAVSSISQTNAPTPGTIINTTSHGGNHQNIITGNTPIFHIQSTTGSGSSGTSGGVSQQTSVAKIQTINASSLTPQQQQSLLQNFKQQQQQFKTVQQPQQSLIIKQQQILSSQQQQQQQQLKLQTAQTQGKSVVVTGGQMTNIIAATNRNAAVVGGQIVQKQQQQQQNKTITMATQPQTITRIFKPVTASGSNNNQTNQVMARNIRTTATGTASGTNTTGNPLMAKVLTNSTGQIISLESLLQKQGGTLRVGNSSSVKSSSSSSSSASGGGQQQTNTTNLIQLASPSNSGGSQITQYAVVSQGRNIISVGQPQRLITTQANSGGTAVVAVDGGGGGVVGTATHSIGNALTVTKSSSGNISTVASSAATKVLPANQIQAITAQQLANAKIIGKTLTMASVATTSATTSGSGGGGGTIRMINAPSGNFNIANIHGKQVIFASKPSTNVVSASSQTQTQHQQQQQQQQVTTQNTHQSVVIGGQTLKLQGNVISPASVQILNKNQSNLQSSSQTTQTVVMGNQILKVQKQQSHLTAGTASASGTASTPLTTIASTNTGTVVVNSSSVNHQMAGKTAILNSSGQTIRLQGQQLQQLQQQQQQSGTTVATSSPQGTPLKAGTSRVVLAVQGGGQIFLSPTFQGGAINLKSLQGMKVVSLQQQQQTQSQQQQNTTQSQQQQKQQQQQQLNRTNVQK